MKEIIDIEEFAKQGKAVPKQMDYKIRVDRVHYVVNVEYMTGKEILTLAGKNPFNRFQLNQKIKGAVNKVDYDQKVDFTEHGVERFMTLPLDQTEG
ncbi:multiubiquitin domain-containing protein [Fulvivirga sp. 29W222]|uniref:Multiubiquitin domain-containing protein n=1 Tax=Fulvivirga marina TaxID=2494733 RepID=A0A937FXW5_9BACT|nr:multiubiquitin domain-containing protein [Fulvivirga marina]MBL6446400.1 multiubiquitin domain-containing protein [Fulvivirga marina]